MAVTLKVTRAFFAPFFGTRTVFAVAPFSFGGVRSNSKPETTSVPIHGLGAFAPAERALDRSTPGRTGKCARAAGDREVLRLVPHGLDLHAPRPLGEREGDISLPIHDEPAGGCQRLSKIRCRAERRPHPEGPGVLLRDAPKPRDDSAARAGAAVSFPPVALPGDTDVRSETTPIVA